MAKLDWSKLQLVTEYSQVDPSNPESVEVRASQLEDTAKLLLEIHRIKARIKSKKTKCPHESDDESEHVI